MKQENSLKKQTPTKKFKAGAIGLTIWKNQSKEGDHEYATISVERSYLDKEGNWQKTNSYRINDLPKVALVMEKAYEFLTLQADNAQV